MAQISESQASALLARWAPAMTHTLNNLTGNVFAAIDSLTQETATPAMARAQRALASASAGLLALAAANHLLGLEAAVSAGPAGDDRRPLGTSLLDATFEQQLLDDLQEVAQLHMQASDPRLMACTVALDRPTVRAVLMCAAYLVRKSVAAQTELQGQLVLDNNSAPARLTLVVQAQAQPLDQQALQSAHPWALALQLVQQGVLQTELDVDVRCGVLRAALRLHQG